jgi:proteasome lid subunit RPN8/RPN11
VSDTGSTGEPRRPPVVTMPRAVLDAVLGHAIRDAPLECCGLLLGSPDHVSASVAARNAQSSPTRFLIHPEDHFAAIRSARDSGRAVCGVYHSHPVTSALPSPTDIEAAEGDAELLWVIVSLQPGPRGIDVRAYRPRNGNFDPIELVLLD